MVETADLGEVEMGFSC